MAAAKSDIRVIFSCPIDEYVQAYNKQMVKECVSGTSRRVYIDKTQYFTIFHWHVWMTDDMLLPEVIEDARDPYCIGLVMCHGRDITHPDVVRKNIITQTFPNYNGHSFVSLKNNELKILVKGSTHMCKQAIEDFKQHVAERKAEQEAELEASNTPVMETNTEMAEQHNQNLNNMIDGLAGSLTPEQLASLRELM